MSLPTPASCVPGAKSRRRGGGPHCALRVALPDGRALELAAAVSVTGQELLAQVCTLLRVRDSRFFGISISIRNEHVFMEPQGKLGKYCPKQWLREVAQAQAAGRSGPPLTVFFRAQCYVDLARAIRDPVSRHWYYAQVRAQVRASRCAGREEAFFSLAALALQCDFGDLAVGPAGAASGKTTREDAEAHGDPTGRGGDQGEPAPPPSPSSPPPPTRHGDAEYFDPSDYFPAWVLSRRGRGFVLRHAPRAHAELAGLARGRALLRFVREACTRLADDVPVTRYHLLLHDKHVDRELILGVSFDGLQIFQGPGKHQGEFLYAVPWTNIRKISAQGSRFVVRLEGRASTGGRLTLCTGHPRHASGLLHHVRRCHQLHVQLQPLLARMRAREQDGLPYRECFISDYPDSSPPEPPSADLDPARPQGARQQQQRGDCGDPLGGEAGVAADVGQDETQEELPRGPRGVTLRRARSQVVQETSHKRPCVEGTTARRHSFQGLSTSSSTAPPLVGRTSRPRSRSLDGHRSPITITTTTATVITTTVATIIPTKTTTTPTNTTITTITSILATTTIISTTITPTTIIPTTINPTMTTIPTIPTIITSTISSIIFLPETTASLNPHFPNDPGDPGDPGDSGDPGDPGEWRFLETPRIRDSGYHSHCATTQRRRDGGYRSGGGEATGGSGGGGGGGGMMGRDTALIPTSTPINKGSSDDSN
uniref:Uncharacterized protein LOC116947108 n=1 Tax=Petromyzon marinus TaxID=7757 RepID=A0AAJ7TKW3_PETMA|nr:uncharacterized protein LOC116947108 [Petromyzon marinus]